MKKLIVIFSLIVVSSSLISAQSLCEPKTKMYNITSKTGVTIKYIDYVLPGLDLIYGKADTKVKKIISDGIVGYFYEISYESTKGAKLASIEYQDLVDILIAMNTLKIES